MLCPPPLRTNTSYSRPREGCIPKDSVPFVWAQLAVRVHSTAIPHNCFNCMSTAMSGLGDEVTSAGLILSRFLALVCLFVCCCGCCCFFWGVYRFRGNTSHKAGRLTHTTVQGDSLFTVKGQEIGEYQSSLLPPSVVIWLVSLCFKLCQPQRIISGLRETFIKRYILERTNKAEIRPEEQSEKAQSCRENLRS